MTARLISAWSDDLKTRGRDGEAAHATAAADNGQLERPARMPELHPIPQEGNALTQTDRRFVRPTGASATLGRTGFPRIVSATGGTLEIKTGPE